MIIEFIVIEKVAYPAVDRSKNCAFEKNGNSIRVVSTFEEVFFGDVEKPPLVPCWQTCVLKDCPARRRAACTFTHLVAINRVSFRKEPSQNGD